MNARSHTALTDLAEGVGPGRDHERLGWVQGDSLPDRTSRPVTTNINITTFNACVSVSEVHCLQKALLDAEHFSVSGPCVDSVRVAASSPSVQAKRQVGEEALGFGHEAHRLDAGKLV